MTSFKTAAIPTLYNGRQYRSRLEARWAAFFDMLCLGAEYEPFDLGRWSPDFILSRGPHSVLIEVKPISEFCQKTADKMVQACRERDIAGDLAGLVLLGLQPRKVDDMISPLRLGWTCDFACPDVLAGETEPEWKEAALAWCPTWPSPGLQADILAGHECNWLPLTAPMADFGSYWQTAYPDHAMALWARATNAVQWRGEQAQP
jgi:hypothetical protein